MVSFIQQSLELRITKQWLLSLNKIFEDTKGVVESRKSEERQTMQWPIERQTIQWPRERQTMQWPRERQTIQ
jgi:hypothetical protein